MRLNIASFAQMKQQQQKIAVLTCYDASFAALLDEAGVDIILIGDSLGMVIQGQTTTLPVSLEHIEYHTRCVVQGSRRPFIIADLPFGSYQESPEQAYRSSARLLAAGAQMVKVEGGAWLLPTIEFLVRRSIPVCGHLGLLPQSIHQVGGYKVQGKTPETARQLHDEARQLSDAGIDLLVFELIPAALAGEVTAAIRVPTIGIGAGAACSGQVLVLYDMLGIYPGKTGRFVRNFMTEQNSIQAAVHAYVTAVKEGSFPAAEHSF